MRNLCPKTMIIPTPEVIAVMPPSTCGPPNSMNHTEIPLDMRFNDGHLVSIIGFAISMTFSCIGNVTVLYSILRSRNKSQINLMLLHLAVADLLVTFLMMPMEIGWAATVSWEGGEVMCRLMSFFRSFGLYLSGFVVMCISMDRYCAVLHPLAVGEAVQRGRRMLTFAWIASSLFSLPQAVVFTAMRHPKYTWYVQCVTYRVLTTHAYETLYAVLTGTIPMYLVPLVTIIYCYSAIIMEICKRAVDIGETKMRRSNSGNLCRAKVRTLKMTVTIVLAFLLCWTPYNVMMIWYFIDRRGALSLDPKVQKFLLLFASTNSSFNPLVYGLYNIPRPNSRPPGVPSSMNRTGVAVTERVPITERVPPLRIASARVLALRAQSNGTSARRPTM